MVSYSLEQVCDGQFHIWSQNIILCLLGVFRPTREFFTYMETSPLPMKAYARHSWPLSRGDSIACHTYYDKDRTSDTHTYSRAFGSGAATTCFSVAAGIRTTNLLLAGRTLLTTRHRCGWSQILKNKASQLTWSRCCTGVKSVSVV